MIVEEIETKKMNARKKLIDGLVVVVMIAVIGAVFATSQTSDKNTIRLRKYRLGGDME
jgi:cytochrome bd-type quinol oxidase subunit 2